MAHDQGGTPKPWFTLGRHNDGEDESATDETPTDDTEPDNPDEADEAPEGDKPDEEPKKPDADWKRRSREWEKRAKENAQKAKAFDELEAAKKSAEERLAEAKTAAEQRAEKAMQRAVKSEILALASNQFADPSDAVAVLDAGEFIDGDDIDTEGIAERLSDLLEAKPHWGKPKPEDPKPPKPKPDPSQGARGEPQKTDYRTASRDDVAAAAAKYGLRLKSQ